MHPLDEIMRRGQRGVRGSSRRAYARGPEGWFSRPRSPARGKARQSKAKQGKARQGGAGRVEGVNAGPGSFSASTHAQRGT